MFTTRLIKSLSTNIPKTYGIRHYSLFTPVDKNSTPLHATIESVTDLSEIEALVNTYDEDDLRNMLITVDKRGNTPLDLLLEKVNCTQSRGKDIYGKLLKLAIKNQKMSPLKSVVTVSDQYPSSHELFQQMQLVCSVITQSRKVIKASNTHPDYNKLSPTEKKALQQKISLTRAVVNTIQFTAPKLRTPEVTFSVCSQSMVGNCLEFGYVFIELLKREAREELWAAVIEFDNADHVFAVCGSQPLLFPNHYNVIHSNIIFGDAWSGVAGQFTRKELTEKVGHLKNYTLDNEDFNVIAKFNPEYHRFAFTETFHIIPGAQKVLISNPRWLSLFKRGETLIQELLLPEVPEQTLKSTL